MINSKLSFFKTQSPYKKLLMLISGPLIITFMGLLFLTFTDGWVPLLYNPLTGDLSKKGSQTYLFNREHDLQIYQRAFPHKEYTIQLSKVILNLKRHSKSGPTPMGYVEVYVGANTQQSTIEIKDREKEFMVIIPFPEKADVEVADRQPSEQGGSARAIAEHRSEKVESLAVTVGEKSVPITSSRG